MKAGSGKSRSSASRGTLGNAGTDDELGVGGSGGDFTDGLDDELIDGFAAGLAAGASCCDVE